MTQAHIPIPRRSRAHARWLLQHVADLYARFVADGGEVAAQPAIALAIALTDQGEPTTKFQARALIRRAREKGLLGRDLQPVRGKTPPPQRPLSIVKARLPLPDWQERPLLELTEVAGITGYTPHQIRRMRHTGELPLPTIGSGTNLRFKTKALVDLLTAA